MDQDSGRGGGNEIDGLITQEIVLNQDKEKDNINDMTINGYLYSNY